jgi:hypothetical protein
MHEVLAASAPEHISHKFQNPAHYDSTLRSLTGVYVESDTAWTLCRHEFSAASMSMLSSEGAKAPPALLTSLSGQPMSC